LDALKRFDAFAGWREWLFADLRSLQQRIDQVVILPRQLGKAIIKYIPVFELGKNPFNP
jgi:hypothetical protein